MSSSPSDQEPDYFDYLLQRSRLALFYRNWWLYPRLNRYLSGRVLDVGCGIGDLLAYRKDTVGVDINPRAVEWCRRQGHDARVMDPDVLPFGDAEFDGVVLDNVLEHLSEPAPLLAEIRRVLPVGGTLIVGVPGRKGYASDPDHKIFYDGDALVGALAAAGFGTRKVLHMPMKSAWMDENMPQFCMYGVFTRG